MKVIIWIGEKLLELLLASLLFIVISDLFYLTEGCAPAECLQHVQYNIAHWHEHYQELAATSHVPEDQIVRNAVIAAPVFVFIGFYLLCLYLPLIFVAFFAFKPKGYVWRALAAFGVSFVIFGLWFGHAFHYPLFLAKFFFPGILIVWLTASLGQALRNRISSQASAA